MGSVILNNQSRWSSLKEKVEDEKKWKERERERERARERAFFQLILRKRERMSELSSFVKITAKCQINS